MADDKTTANEQEAPELAANMWFKEYDMPYTTIILENEAAYANAYPDAQTGDRHPIAQYIIDQETAVARDFLEGKISEAEFNNFKELSEARIESMGERLEAEMDELGEDADVWIKEFGGELVKLEKEHGAEIGKLAEKLESGDLKASDVSLHLAADMMGTVFEGVDKLNDMLPPHVHDLFEVVETEILETAHDMVDAREELSSADEHNLDRDREVLEEIEPIVEAEFDQAHEEVDEHFERQDADIERAQEAIDVAKEHAELNPDISVEYAPYQITEDYDAIDQMEEEVGGHA